MRSQAGRGGGRRWLRVGARDGQQVGDSAADVVVWRRAVHGRRRPPAGQHRQVPVADAGVEAGGPLATAATEFLVHSGDEFARFLCRDVAAGVVLDPRVVVVTLEGDEVAAHRDLAVDDRYPHARGLEHRAALRDAGGIVTQDGQVRDGGVGRPGDADGAGQAETALTSEAVDGRLVRDHQGRLAAEAGDRPIAHAVPDDDDGLHPRTDLP